MKRSSLREREVMRGSESCSFPWRLALRSAAQGTNLKASHHDDGDIYIYYDEVYVCNEKSSLPLHFFLKKILKFFFKIFFEIVFLFNLSF